MMAGPVSTKPEKDKSAGKAKENVPELARRSTAYDPYSDIMDLQSMAGNRAVSQLLQPDMNSVPPIVQDVLNSGNVQPLDLTVREFMESRFSHDFSQVRVHADAKAGESARAVDALAYTVGQDIFFGAGQYHPKTENGQKLLAHELTHVIQQENAIADQANGMVYRQVEGPRTINIESSGLSIDLNNKFPKSFLFLSTEQKGTVSNVSWGETSSIRPTGKNLNQPDKWDPDKTYELLQARAAIHEVAKRGESVRRAKPDEKKEFDRKTMPYHYVENFPETDPEIADSRVKWFYLSNKKDEPKHHPSPQAEKVKTYGPFYQTYNGTPPDPQIGPVWIHFYRLKPAVTTAPKTLQPRLTVSQPGDAYEQEAERVAEQVMRMTPLGLSVADTVPPIVHDVLRSSGQALDAETRAFFESRFDHDLSQVRLHTDAQAGESARVVSAMAYTVGRDIVFAPGFYAPGTESGRRLIGHELVHVMQQRGQKVSADMSLRVGQAGDSSEREAEYLASQISAPAGVVQPGTVQRQPGRTFPGRSGLPAYDARIPLEPAPLSFELQDAPLSDDARQRVKLWLRMNLRHITAAETQFGIDRRAIAGAIAWEALENIRTVAARASGPGKVHYSANLGPGEGDPVAKQVEQAGYLPPQKMEQRKEILKTAAGAIRYIAAIMRAEADEAAKSGYYLNCDPPMLATFYNAWDLNDLKNFFAKRKAPAPLSPNDTMGTWVAQNEDFLEDAIGKPAGLVCKPYKGYVQEFHQGPLRLARQEVAGPGCSPLSQSTEASKNPDPVSDFRTLLSGIRRARIVREFAQELRKIGTKYNQEVIDVTKGKKSWKEARKDWDNYRLADCTKFLQWALEKSGEGNLIGRQNTSIPLILSIIAGLQNAKQATFKSTPMPGDLMLWTGHVAIVLSVWQTPGTTYFSFAHMGSSGAQIAGEGTQEMKLDLNQPKQPGYDWINWGHPGASGFLGFWTPPLQSADVESDKAIVNTR